MIEEFYDNKEDTKKKLIIKAITREFIQFLLEQSKVITSKNRIWEMLRGVMNRRFQNIAKNDKEKYKLII